MIRIPKSDFRPGDRRKIKVNDKELLIVYLGADRFYVVDSKCPHLGCDLSKVGVVIREELVCQCHFTHFSLVDGKAIKGATKKPLKTYKVTVEKEDIIVED
jgi:nitrite reductase/ring-hydroxylating ferredoxin subunit